MTEQTTHTCRGISYTPFARGEALLAVISPALVLQIVTSLAIENQATSEALVQIVIPLLDAVHTNTPLGVFRGKAKENAQMADLNTVPWAWEGEVIIEERNRPVIDSERFISSITEACAGRTHSAATTAFMRDHPWLTQTFADTAAREEFANRLSDDRLAQLFGQTSDTLFETVLREAKPAQRNAFNKAARNQSVTAGGRLFIQMLRAHLTRPRFPPLALVLPDTHKSRTYVERLFHESLKCFLFDSVQAMENR